MKAATMDRIGRYLRAMQMHRLDRVFSSNDYIRVTVSHYVKDTQHFEVIVRRLAENYRFITPQEFFSCFNGQTKIKGRNLLMTFDDGLKSSYDAIKNVLSKFSIKTIFFIPTKILQLQSHEEMKRFVRHHIYYDKSPNDLPEDEYITVGKNEILDLSKEGHMISPHTHTHPKLIDIRDAQTAEKEIVQPRKILEDLLHRRIDAFAFPVGTERVVSSFVFPYIQREYKFCFSALSGKNTEHTDPYFIHRDSIHAHYTLPHVVNITEGVFDLYYRGKMLLLKNRLSGMPISR